MATDTITCGNCQTENPKDQDFCIECGQPLTGSGEQEVRENIDAEGSGSFIGNDNMIGRESVAPGLAGGAGGIPTHLGPSDADRRDTRDW